ncbi:hypothetical protein GE061_016417 [Apolygus lucorum]|uniref:Zinc finger PHD-type domain-containing protein n=1 Tax=Apolygus lucorum TaxID=248454 RepID=A0A6A4JZ55_APOLU|nr:hypothetical protein GE061_016417 [Apolygus lucorum]
MTDKCNSCRKGFAHNAYKMKCSVCKGVFHLECVNFKKEDYLFHKDSQTPWNCKGCLKVKRLSSRDDSIDSRKSASDDDGESDLKQIILSFRKEVTLANKDMKRELSNNSSDIKDLKEHLNTYSDYIKENTDAIGALRAELASLREQNEQLRTHNDVLQKKVNALEAQVVDNEQNALAKVVEISGIPSTTNENVVDIVKSVCRAVEFDMSESMFDNCFRRRPSPKSNFPGIICLSFIRRLDKDAFISATRRKRDLSTHDVGIDTRGDPSRIFINQSLTYHKRQLLNRAKVFKKEHQFKFVWIRSGSVMIRKDENSTIYEVRKADDLDKILSKNGQPPRS